MALHFYKNRKAVMDIKEIIEKDREFLRARNFSENYIKELCENTSKWSKVRLLEGIENPIIARNTAILMENQRLANESNGRKLEDYQMVGNRLSIPVIRRVFPCLVANEMVSFQVMRKPEDTCYYTDFDGRTVPVKMTVVTRFRENHFNHLEDNGENYIFNLDREAEAVAEYCSKLSDEITREVIGNLAPNAGTFESVEFKNKEQLKKAIESLAFKIGSKIYNFPANWMVTSSRVVNILEEFLEGKPEGNTSGVKFVGMMKNIKVFEDVTAPDENILMGYKDHKNPLFTGYIYAPYTFFNLAEKRDSKSMVGMRYARTLGNPNFYGTMKIENLPTPLDEGEK